MPAWLLACLMCVLATGVPRIPYAGMSECLSSTGEAAVSACERELARNPESLKARLAMCDALAGLRRYQDAVDVLEKGLTIHPGNSELEQKLAIARSYVDEQLFIKRRRVEAEMDALTKRNVIRCTMLKGQSALDACNDVLKLKPDEALLYRAKGDALLGMNRSVEAILAFRKALQLEPADTLATTGIKTAEAQRQTLVRQCSTGHGSSALEACNAALLEGEPDQVIIQTRKGEILLAMNRRDEAIRAYRLAQTLAPKDKALAAKISQLTAPPPRPAKPPARVAAKKLAAAEKPAPELKKTTPAEKPAPELKKTTPAEKPAPELKKTTAGEKVAPKPKKTTVARKTASEPEMAAIAKPAPQSPEELKTAFAEDAGEASPKPVAVPVKVEIRYSNAPRIAGTTH